MKLIPFRPAVKRVDIGPRAVEQHPASELPAGAQLDAHLDALREQLAALVDEAIVDEAREADALQLVAHALDVLLVERLGGAERADASPRLLASIRALVERLEVAP
jgi:hypothetical protein